MAIDVSIYQMYSRR